MSSPEHEDNHSSSSVISAHDDLNAKNFWNREKDYHDAIQKILFEIWGFSETQALKQSRTVYHYTSSAGIAGILQAGDLWLTNSSYLNDPSEILHGIKLINEIKSRFAQNKGGGISSILDKIQVEKNSWPLDTFIGSLSYSRDQLNQWTRYADNGKGFAIAFDKKKLQYAAMLSTAQNIDKKMTEKGFLVTAEVNYSFLKLEEKLEEILSKTHDALNSYLSQLASLSGEELEKYAYEISKNFYYLYSRIFLIFSSAIKHTSYKDEKEFRILALIKKDARQEILYRARNHDLVPYVSFNWRCHEPKAIKEIIIGPAANKKSAEDFLKTCFHQFDLKQNIKITHSKLPYTS